MALKGEMHMFCSSILAGKQCYLDEEWTFINITRPFSIIYYVTEGTAFYEIDGKVSEFIPGRLYIFPSNSEYSLYKNGNASMYHLYFHAYIYPEVKNLICLEAENDEFLFTILRELLRFTTNSNSYAPSLPSQKLLELLISYVSEITNSDEVHLPAKIKQYIDQNYIRLFEKNDLSSVFGYSTSRINHFFKSEYGMTTSKYRDSLMIKHIIRLLKEGQSSKYISDELGFSSPASFCRFVKTKYGVNPSEVRKFKDFTV